VAACAILLGVLTPLVRDLVRRHAIKAALRGIETIGAETEDVGLFFWSIYRVDLRRLSLDESSFEQLSRYLDVLDTAGCDVELYVDCGQLSSERVDKLKRDSPTIDIQEREHR